MAKDELTIMIGGEAGQGLVTIGQVLGKTLVRQGWRIVVTQGYMSRIRGGHNTFVIRAALEEIMAPAEGIDLMVALNQETISLHEAELNPGARVVADTGLACGLAACFNVPYGELADKRYVNTLALGVCGALLGLPEEPLAEALSAQLHKLPEDVIQANREAVAAAYEYTGEKKPEFEGLHPSSGAGDRIMLHGNEAIALGALAAGVKFLSFYPMTPSTSIALNIIANATRMGVITEQAEDEIAAINMALGASYAGAPALVTTSGGGFALMGEGISLAGASETPVVVAVVMRPGPATGLPTRTEQGDLELVLFAGHGEFPRAIFAPGSVEQCFDLTHKAFHLAEALQGPVFILSDQYLADSYRSVAPFDLTAYDPVMSGTRDLGLGQEYRRYEVTDSGVSPRALPGLGEELVVADSDEHTSDGHITEDLSVRMEMNDKRLRKMDMLLDQVVPPEICGPEDAEVLLVCWGSSRGAVWEALDKLSREGKSAAACHFSQVWPLKPELFLERFQKARRVVFVEGNATGQLENLVRRETSFQANQLITRYDGLPITVSHVLSGLEAEEVSHG